MSTFLTLTNDDDIKIQKILKSARLFETGLYEEDSQLNENFQFNLRTHVNAVFRYSRFTLR